MLYGANRNREAAIAASRQRVTGQPSPRSAAAGETYRPTPQQPLPPAPNTGARLTPMERRVAQALELNPSLSDSQINTMLFGTSPERPEDKLIGIIRRRLQRKAAPESIHGQLRQERRQSLEEVERVEQIARDLKDCD